ncbi:MAG: tRNA-dihydrouridine synthase family protein [Planctomycetaceae bacterium]|nr:tRNA-dihydrouridine synthase family protein [Planctomycetaceae bacterium]
MPLDSSPAASSPPLPVREPPTRPFAPLHLGRVELAHPFVQAALSGYSDVPMRRLAREYGASYTVAEVMIDRFANEAKGKGRTAHYFEVADIDHPVGAQLMGSEPASFVPAAERLVDAGFDVIDVNFGCPVKTAMGGCRGGYHLGQPDVAISIIQRVRDTVPAEIPVTVKMRRGIDDSAESRDRFFEILDGAFAAGVAAVTVHGRTVEQKYVGPSRWEFLAEVKRHVGKQTILGSGDLFNAKACVDMMEQTGVDGVTIARGAIGNPWIFEQCVRLATRGEEPLPPTVFEQRAAIRRHRELVEEIYGPDRWLGVLKKFGYKYARLHPRFESVRAKIGKIRSANEWDTFFQTEYAIDEAGRFPDVDDVST